MTATNKLIALVFVPLTFLAILFVALWLYIFNADMYEGYTGEARGVVTKVDYTPAGTASKGRTVIHYRYEAGGHVYEDELTGLGYLSSRYTSGQKIKIVYRPDIPSLSLIDSR